MSDDPMMVEVVCSLCGGGGYPPTYGGMIEHQCPRCEGTGRGTAEVAPSSRTEKVLALGEARLAFVRATTKPIPLPANERDRDADAFVEAVKREDSALADLYAFDAAHDSEEFFDLGRTLASHLNVTPNQEGV